MSFAPGKSVLNILGILSAAALTVAVTGCANMVTTAPVADSLSPLGHIAGNVHGGNQPVANATVNLYAAGTTGYGSAATLLATGFTSNDGAGSFSFSQVQTQPSTLGTSYACPSPNSLIYITAVGGDTQSGGAQVNNNAASVMFNALGKCSGVGSESIVINELTTVAAVFALQQYISPGSTTPGSFSIGTASDYTITTPSQSGQGLINAFNTALLLATPLGHVQNTAVTGSGTNLTNATVSVVPEASKLNTIADILAACVNQTTSTSTAQCSTLFSNASAPTPSTTSQPTVTFATAVDTVQAAYYMATNPTDGSTTNLSNIYALAVAGAPFQPTLSATPTDWTLALTYISASTCTNSGVFIGYAYDISVDASGNIWMANGPSATTGTMTEMSNGGKPLACSGIIGATRGGVAIDTAGNAWSGSGFAAVTGTPSNIYKFDGTNTTSYPLATVGAKAYAVAADGSGNVFVTDSGKTLLYEIPSGTAAGTAPTSLGTVGASPYGIAIDPKGTVIVGQSGSGGNVITAFPLTTVGGTTYASPTSLTQNAYVGVYGIAFDSSNNFWVGNSAGSSGTGTTDGNSTSSTAITYSTTTPGAAVTATFATPANLTADFAGGISTGRKVAIDGANNVWIANNTAASSTLYAVSEFSKTGTALSPTSTAGTTTVTENGGFQKAATVLSGPRGIAVDFSGNVWVSNTGSTTNNWVTEIVGAAVPAITPLSIAAKNSTFGTKPTN